MALRLPENPEGQDLATHPPVWTYAPKGTAKKRQMAEFDALADGSYKALVSGSGLDRAVAAESFRVRANRDEEQAQAQQGRTAIRDAVVQRMSSTSPDESDPYSQWAEPQAPAPPTPPDAGEEPDPYAQWSEQAEPDRGEFVAPRFAPDNGSGDDYLPTQPSEPDNYRPGQGVVRRGSASEPGAPTIGSVLRRVVPQPVRDVAGETFKELTSGEAFANAMVPQYKGQPLGGFTPGTDIGEQIGRIPRVGGMLRAAADIAGAPATWGSAGIGPSAQASFKSLPLAARVPLNIAAPASRSANFGTRLAAETAIGTAATVGAQETAKRTDNPFLIGAAGLGAGVLASGAVTAAPRTLRGAKKGALAYRDLTENIPVGMSLKAVNPDDLTAGKQSIMDALTEETRLRRSGIVEAEKSAGYARQAAGIAQGIEAATGANASLGETVRAAKAGARGRLRQTFAPAIELNDAHKSALIAHVTDSLQGRQFEQMNALDSLDKLISGEGIQPAQIKLLRRVMGDDFANAVEQVNRSRPSATAPITPEGRAAIDAALSGERQITTYEQRAAAQLEHSNNLMAEYGMNPTEKRLKALSEEARAKGVDFRAKADELSIAQGRRYADDAAQQSARRQSGYAEAQIRTAEREALIAERARGAADIQAALSLAELTDADKALIQSAADQGEQGVRRLEVQAQKARASATELARQAQQRPGDARFGTKAARAQQRADSLAASADAMLRRQTSGMNESAARQQARDASRQGVKAQRQAEAAALAADKAAPSPQMLVDRARALIGERPGISSALDRGALADFDYTVNANRAILDIIGETAHERLASISAAASGNLSDSYLTALFHRKVTLEGLLEHRGVDPKISRKIGNLMVDAELKQRYPAGVPERLTAEIAKTKGLTDGPMDRILKGAAAASAEGKKAAFWADFGIMGQAGLNAVTTPVNLVTGMVNRALANAHLSSVDTSLGAADRRLQYARDGLMIRGSVGASTPTMNDGWILRGIPGLKTVDKKIGDAINWVTRAQYDSIMGGLAELKHEGNLVSLDIAHRLGLTPRAITDQNVRATSAAMANAETMKAFRALSTRRATVENAALLSPSMRRAQVAHILQLARTIDPRATPEQRVLGALGIMSTAIGTLAIGKLLNDLIGVGDFEFDPSKPGYGQITTGLKDKDGRNQVVSMFPQQQVVSANAKAMRALAEADPALAAREWGKLGMGSSSQVLQTLEKAAGVGYEPGRGYRFGDYGKELTPGQRLAATLPIPPVAQGALTGTGQTPVGTALDFGGLTNFPESPTQAVKRPDFDYSTLKGTAQLEAHRAQAWRDLQSVLGADATGGAESYSQWLKDTVGPLTHELRQRGFSEAQSVAVAEEIAAKRPAAVYYEKLRNLREDQWGMANPKEAAEVLDAESRLPARERRFNPTKPVRAYIESRR